MRHRQETEEQIELHNQILSNWLYESEQVHSARTLDFIDMHIAATMANLCYLYSLLDTPAPGNKDAE